MDDKILGKQGLRTLLSAISNKFKNISFNKLIDKPFEDNWMPGFEATISESIESGVVATSIKPVNFDVPSKWEVIITTSHPDGTINTASYEITNMVTVDNCIYLRWRNSIEIYGHYDLEAVVQDNKLTLLYYDHSDDVTTFKSLSVRQLCNDSTKIPSQYLSIDWNAEKGENGYILNRPFGGNITRIEKTLVSTSSQSGSYTFGNDFHLVDSTCLEMYNRYHTPYNWLCNSNTYYELILDQYSTQLNLGFVKFNYDDVAKKYNFNTYHLDSSTQTFEVEGFIDIFDEGIDQDNADAWRLVFIIFPSEVIEEYVQNNASNSLITHNNDGTYTLRFNRVYVVEYKNTIEKLDEKYLPDFVKPSQLQEEVANKLAEAKESGEFDGADGITPHIGDNGNWFIGEEDTGVNASGKFVLSEEDKASIVEAVIAAMNTTE